MYRKDDAGNHIFEGTRQRETGDFLEEYIFEKMNYEEHEFRHRISDQKALAEIEATLFDPDLITGGPKPKSKRNFYKVMSYQDGPRGERSLLLWRAHCFREGSRTYSIATAFYGPTPVSIAIHWLEEVIWRKPGSKI